MGGYITGIIGILIFPWKLIADPQGYIFRWLIAYSALLGAMAGIMICDYYIIRKTKIQLPELFKTDSIYRNWNTVAWIAFFISLVPVIPGFLVAVGIYSANYFPEFLVNLYSYAWFVTFILSFLIYWVLKKKPEH
jgi:NCS1 family nucleobase:cation symporter-1